jgi:hypothetical protein
MKAMFELQGFCCMVQLHHLAASLLCSFAADSSSSTQVGCRVVLPALQCMSASVLLHSMCGALHSPAA